MIERETKVETVSSRLERHRIVLQVMVALLPVFVFTERQRLDPKKTLPRKRLDAEKIPQLLFNDILRQWSVAEMVTLNIDMDRAFTVMLRVPRLLRNPPSNDTLLAPAAAAAFLSRNSLNKHCGLRNDE